MLFDLCLLLRSFIFHRIFARIQNKDPTSGSGNGGGQSQFQLFSVMPENMLFYGEIYTAGKNFTLPPVVAVVTILTSALANNGLTALPWRRKGMVHK